MQAFGTRVHAYPLGICRRDMGVSAGGSHPAADRMPDEETFARLGHICKVVTQTVAATPLQNEQLARTGCAPIPLRGVS